MQHHRLSGDDERRYLLVLEDGDEVVEELVRFARERRLRDLQFTGIGSFAEVRLDSGRRLVAGSGERLEVRSLDGEFGIQVHAYLVVRTARGDAWAGRLAEGRVREALKLVVVETDGPGARLAG